MTTTARAAKIVAMSVGGGAAATLLGATAAHAGDADAVGNQAATKGGQSLTVTDGAGPVTGGVTGTVTNVGAAGANTGVNGAEEVEITTGDARSSGNHAHNELDQAATHSGTGSGMALLDQDAHIASGGLALADTGFNTGATVATGDAEAWGSRSWNKIQQDLGISGESDGIRIADQWATIGSFGAAWAETGVNSSDGDLVTGNASAGGNESASAATQSGAVTQDSIGLALVQQRSRTRNLGAALANTGVNSTTGDDSTNLAQVFQNGELVDESTENDD